MFHPRCIQIVILHLITVLAMSGVESITTGPRAEEVTALAMTDLRAGDSDPLKVVMAAFEFAEVFDYYKSVGDNDHVAQMQAYIYWCRKRMPPELIKAFIYGKGPAASNLAIRIDVVASNPVPNDQADAYFAAAEKFATDHPEAQFAIAMRYFEVADRFAGLPSSLKAQRLTLEAQHKAYAAGSGKDDSVGRELKAQFSTVDPLPQSANEAIDASNLMVGKITAKASSDIEPDRQKIIAALLKEADVEQKKGSLDTLLAIQAQMANVDEAKKGLTKPAQAAVDAYGKAKKRAVDKAILDILAEKKRLSAALDRVQVEEVKNGNTAGAVAIKGAGEQITKFIDTRTPREPIIGKIEFQPFEKFVKDLTRVGNWSGPLGTTDGTIDTEWRFPGGNVTGTWTAAEPVPIQRIVFIGRWKWEGDTVTSGEVLVNGDSVGKFGEWLEKTAIVVTLAKPVKATTITLVVGPAFKIPSVSEIIIK